MSNANMNMYGNLSRKDCAFPLLPCSSITTVQSIFHQVQDQRHRATINRKTIWYEMRLSVTLKPFFYMFFSRKWPGYTLVLVILWRARIEISYKVYEVLIVIIESKLTRDIIYHFSVGFSSRLLLPCVDYCCCHHFEYFGCWR